MNNLFIAVWHGEWDTTGSACAYQFIISEDPNSAQSQYYTGFYAFGTEDLDEGNFEVGDSVNCLNAEGKRVAKGLINYSSLDIKKIMKRKTSEIEKILGYKYSDEAIHRDNMIVL